MYLQKKRRLFAVMAGVAIAVGPTVALPVSATPEGDNVVINEIYVRGGSKDSTYAHKFIELYNPTNLEVTLDGLVLGYVTDKGKAAKPLPLSGSVAAKGYYLVSAGSNGNVGQEIDADATAQFSLSGKAGTVILANNAAVLSNISASTNVAGKEGVVDAAGWGSASIYEGIPYTGKATGVQSYNRLNGEDTNNNSVDFALSDPSPVNSKQSPAPTPTNTPTVAPTSAPTDQPTVAPTPVPSNMPTAPNVSGQVLTIAEIQGSGDVTPFAGQTVTTRGIVTAAYPTGGFNGVYIQTPGSGGTHTGTASSGIFVYSRDMATTLSVGDYVEVTGEATEWNSLTQIAASSFTRLTESAPAPQPVKLERIPADEAGKEALEGMLVEVTGPLTVTNNYSTNQYGQVGLAHGTQALRQPSDVYNPTANPQEIAALDADNKANLITLDDGLSWSYTGGKKSHPEVPLPYISKENPLRVGAGVTLKKPMILDFRFQWNLQPTSPVTSADGGDKSAEYVTFDNTRVAAPAKVGGDISLSSFNVLNYFTDLGENEAGCKAYKDREGNGVTANRCQVRGAFSAAAFSRQQTKIVKAINTLDSSIVSLEEIENSSKFGHGRDESLSQLVDALNADAGSQRWAFVASPSKLPASEDVIRLGYIYQKTAVKPVGESKILIGNKDFTGYAREPLAQTWQAIDASGQPKGDEFVTVVNHFKSKGSLAKAYPNDQDPYQGNNNKLRVAQAKALVNFITENYANKPVFILGDLNSYKAEDPIVEIEKAGYTEVTKAFGVTGHSYQFSGLVGSLDHVLVNPEALAMVTGADVWNINAMESVALEYSRVNYNVKDLWDGSAFRSSDHDPVKVGLRVSSQTPAPIPSPTVEPTVEPSPEPTVEPTVEPSTVPTPEPSAEPTVAPTVDPSSEPTAQPTTAPTPDPTPHECKPGTSGNVYVANDWVNNIAHSVLSILGNSRDIFAGDFNGDGYDTFAVRQGSSITFYDRCGQKGDTLVFEEAADGEILAGDINGDGKDDLVVHRGKRFFVKFDALSSGKADDSFMYGREGDEAFIGNFAGNDGAGVAVRRGNTFYVRTTATGGNADVVYTYGRAADTAFVGDFDGDGKDTLSVRRGHITFVNNQLNSDGPVTTFSFGRSGDIPLIGDWDGDTVDTLAVVR